MRITANISCKAARSWSSAAARDAASLTAPVTWVQSSHQSAAVVRRSKTKPAERVVNDTGRNGCAPGTVLRRSTVRSYPAQGKMFWNR